MQKGERNKNGGTKIGGQNKKRSVEQKLVSGTKKRSAEQKLVSGTKTAEQKLVGGTKKRSAEQKLVSRTKTAEQKLVGGTSAKRSAEQKLVGTLGHWVTGTPSASAKIIQRIQKSPKQKLVGTVQVQKGQQNKNCGTKIVEQKLVGTLGHWVTGTPSASAKRSAEQKLRNKNW